MVFAASTAAVVVLAALASTTASAVTAGWMLNGRLLLEEGLSSAALSAAPTVDKAFTIGTPIDGSELICTGLAISNGSIKEVNLILATSLQFSGCVTTEPECAVPAAIATVPVSAEVTLDGTLAAKGVLRPETGSVLLTVKYTGETCAAAGVRALTGDVETLFDEGQDERTDQLFLAVQGSNGLLRFASNTATLTGAVLLLLANHQPWSFL
jgi:hypothetical protein